MNTDPSSEPAVAFTIVQEKGRVTNVSTSSSQINHFLDLLQMSRAYNTWVSYTHDLEVFFRIVSKPPEAITRSDCLNFMKHQDEGGCSGATINRRLAAISSLFNELHLLDPELFPRNPVFPRQRFRDTRRAGQSLYRKQAQPVPQILSPQDLQTFCKALPSWRDRTLVMLMWISCLRVGEAVSIRFQDIECSRRSVRIPIAKGNNPRTVFMDPLTFKSLNQYLDNERKNLFPNEEHVFISLKGRARGDPLSVNAVQKMLSYYAEKCRLDHLHAHIFRHTGITQLVQQGMPEPAIRDMVGHRSPDSLLPYLHLCDQFVESEFERAQAALDLSIWLDDSLSGGAK